MNYIMWIVQLFLAAVFAWHGRLYATWGESAKQWHEKLHPDKPQGLPATLRTFIGICEVLAAVGLVLPMLTGILPWLTPLAAMGLILVMLGSAVYHLQRQEYSNVVISLVLIVLCGIVVYGRSATITL